LVAKLMDEYDVAEDKCRHETRDFVNKMIEKKILNVD